MHTETTQHHHKVVEQFSKQAIPFTQLPGHYDAIQLLMEMGQVQASDTVLDVACGPGLVLCEFAKTAQYAVGIDITPIMLKEAAKKQMDLGLNNMRWDLGDVEALPYPDASFSLVITRYSFHHFLHPEKVFAEMYRVCQPGGRIVIADVALPADKVAAYDKMEQLRDDSHTGALSFEEFESLFAQWPLQHVRRTSYKVPMELEAQLAASFPKEGDAEKLRRLFREDLGQNRLGVEAHEKNGQIHFSYPISIYAGEKMG